jgi:rare lipoprotein A
VIVLLKKFFVLPLVLALFVIGGCTSTQAKGSSDGLALIKKNQDGPGRLHLVTQAQEPVPTVLAKSRYGNPAQYTVAGRTYKTMSSNKGYKESGIASWYGKKFHGRLTSTREVYDMYQFTAAHRSLPIPSFVEVSNLDNGKSIIVKVNDRGPFHADRIIDLSYAAAAKLGILAKGTGQVEVRAIDPNAHVLKREAIVTTSSQAKPISTSEPQRKGMFIQLGAYSKINNARSMRKKVKQIIPAAVVHILPAKQSQPYKVQLGPLYSHSLVTELIQDLGKGGVTHYKVIRYK